MAYGIWQAARSGGGGSEGARSGARSVCSRCSSTEERNFARGKSQELVCWWLQAGAGWRVRGGRATERTAKGQRAAPNGNCAQPVGLSTT